MYLFIFSEDKAEMGKEAAGETQNKEEVVFSSPSQFAQTVHTDILLKDPVSFAYGSQK